LYADLADCDDDNPRDTTEQLLEGLVQPADTVLRAAMHDFLGPDRAFGGDQTAATFGPTMWTWGVAPRELRLYVEDLNMRFMTLNGMEQGPAHEPLDIETVVAAFEQFLNPIQSLEFLDLMALPARDLWTLSARSSAEADSISWRTSRCASWRSRRRKRTRSGSTSVFVGSSAPAAAPGRSE
jgi:hypothetical protein